MWTVTLDSNVPIVTKTTHSVSSSARENGSSRKFVSPREERQDVEELLGSTSPFRSRSSSLNKGRPPRTSVSGRTNVDSRSASPLPRVSQSPRRDWTSGIDRKDVLTSRGLDDDLEKRLMLNSNGDGIRNSSMSPMLHCHPHPHPHTNHHDSVGVGVGGGRGPMKPSYDNNRPIVSFPDSDSGFDSMKHRGGTLTSEDINSSLSARLIRSQSMSRLNGSFTGDTNSLSGSQGTLGVSPYKERSIRDLNEALDDSVSRRNVLVHKLKEAQSTLELQSDRLNKIESSAKDNNMLVEDLRFKEREYRKKISHLEAADEEKQRLQMENLRLREQMQDRVSALDYQLKSLKTQHTSAESENNKRLSQLDSTTAALSVMEDENCRLQKDKEKLHSDALMLKELLTLTQNRFGALEMESRNMKNNSLRLKEDNNALTRKVQEMAGQMIELRSLLQAVKDENERLAATWKTSSDDKTRSEKRIEGYQESITDLKARLAATSADRDRLFQEKLHMNSKIQQMVLDKEQMMKTKLNLEDQLNERMPRSMSAKSYDFDYEPDVKEQLKELASVKKVSEELSSELSSVKAFYERALEQIASLERNKSMLQSQQELGDQERRRLQSEIDRLSLAINSQSYDGRREQDYQEEMIQKLRNELKQTRYEKNTLENKNEELETKLSKANEGLREGTALQHSEMDTWKQTCERLTTSVSWKESELGNLTDKNHELEDTVSGLRLELRAVRDKCDVLSDKDDEVKRYHEENKRLIQEKAENEQMIKLLETQKEVLSKNSEGSIHKVNEIESLSLQMDQIRNENQTLRKKVIDLEQEKDDAVFQKDELMASNECMYKTPSLVDLESKMEELREANKQLREMNQTLARQVEEERKELSKSSPESASLKKESNKLREESAKLKSDVSKLKHEYDLLDAKHQRFVIDYGHDGEVAAKEKQGMIQLRKEKDAIQKQVTLLQGQISLMEGSKRRAEDQITKLTAELSEVKAQLKQNSSKQSYNSKSKDPEAESLRKEVEALNKQLASAKETQKVQEKMMESLREESLEDVGVELHQMRDELQQLMKAIQTKEQTIENLEAELKQEKETHSEKSEEIERCRKVMEEMGTENQSLRQNVEEIRDAMASELEQEQQDQQLKRSKSAKSLQEELSEALRAKENRVKTKPSGAYLSKSMNELACRPASAPPMASEAEDPPKSATEGSDRLQSLISKYRSHGDKDGSGTETTQIKPLPGFVTSKIVSKSRFGVSSPKAPMRRTSGDETPISPLAKQENDSGGMSSNIAVRKGKKLPPPPPPKPMSSTTKSSFMRSLSDSNSLKSSNSNPQSTSSYSISASPPTLQSKSATSMAMTKISASTPAATTANPTSQTSLFSSSSSLSKTTPSSALSPPVLGSATSLTSSGVGMSATSAETLGDSQEQKDINALIQKYLKVLESS